MKVLLTHCYFLEEDEKEKEIMRPYPPLGLLYVSAYLKQFDKSTIVVDSTFLTRDQWKSALIKEQPQVLAIYTNLIPKLALMELIPIIRPELNNCILIGGGPDATFNKDEYLAHAFDYLIIGEGEQTMLELVECLENKGDPNDVNGIAFIRDGSLIETKERETIRAIETLPMPDREAINIDAYLDLWERHHGQRTLNISTQRGCPYTCSWCSTSVFGQSYRRNTPEKVVEEILYLKKRWGVEALWFVDDVFSVNFNWLRSLASKFEEVSLSIPFEIVTRAERLNDEILQLLKQMGCFRIWIGAESGSQRIINSMNRKVDLKVVQDMILKTKAFGMEVGTFIMVGYPGETIQDIIYTKQHLQKCVPDLITITKVYPIKGTPLYNEVFEQLDFPVDWKQYTDRDIPIKLPYSERFYVNAIRYLMNAWKYKHEGSFKLFLKYQVAYLLMRIHI